MDKQVIQVTDQQLTVQPQEVERATREAIYNQQCRLDAIRAVRSRPITM